MHRNDTPLGIAGWTAPTAADVSAVARELGRPPRGLVAVAHRCGCEIPAVVVTQPRLPGGPPFPTTFYLTCARMNAAVGALESQGVMARMANRLIADPGLAETYRQAHLDYLRRRQQVVLATGLGAVPEIDGVTPGGMPTRVKCLHALAAHALAVGSGVNPLGDEVVDALRDWRGAGCCGPRAHGSARRVPAEPPTT